MSVSHLRQFLKSAPWVSQVETESHHGGSAKLAVTQVQLAQVPAAKHRANILPLMHLEIGSPHPSWGKQERTLMRVGETQPTPRARRTGGSKTSSQGALNRKVCNPKSRDTTLLTKVRLVKAMVFPVVVYGCESWTIKKAER